jgi:hypothetical protein
MCCKFVKLSQCRILCSVLFIISLAGTSNQLSGLAEYLPKYGVNNMFINNFYVTILTLKIG